MTGVHFLGTCEKTVSASCCTAAPSGPQSSVSHLCHNSRFYEPEGGFHYGPGANEWPHNHSWIPEDSWSKHSVFLVMFLNLEFIITECVCVHTCLCVCTYVRACHGTRVEVFLVTLMPVSQIRATEDLPG